MAFLQIGAFCFANRGRQQGQHLLLLLPDVEMRFFNCTCASQILHLCLRAWTKEPNGLNLIFIFIYCCLCQLLRHLLQWRWGFTKRRGRKNVGVNLSDCTSTIQKTANIAHYNSLLWLILYKHDFVTAFKIIHSNKRFGLQRESEEPKPGDKLF